MKDNISFIFTTIAVICLVIAWITKESFWYIPCCILNTISIGITHYFKYKASDKNE